MALKDSSKLELVVKVKNCTDPKLLPIFKSCDILKEYCLFIEIVEQNYNRLFPKKSFKKAIEIAMEQGILTDYLDRKSREVINMLCAKYSYKDDIAVKQEEARNDGIAIGIQQKAIEDALVLIKDLKISPEVAAEKMHAPLEKVLELQEQTDKKA